MTQIFETSARAKRLGQHIKNIAPSLLLNIFKQNIGCTRKHFLSFHFIVEELFSGRIASWKIDRVVKVPIYCTGRFSLLPLPRQAVLLWLRRHSARTTDPVECLSIQVFYWIKWISLLGQPCLTEIEFVRSMSVSGW